MRLVALVFLAACSLEMGYIILQAGRAEPSHFNESTAFHRWMFSVMAICAVFHALIRKLERQASANGQRLLTENWTERAKEVQRELAAIRATIMRLEELSTSGGSD
jgi:hypothetical protein